MFPFDYNNIKRTLLILLLFLILVTPIFFIIYRIMIFNTTPYDPYYEYLLYHLGKNPGFVPQSPFIYRFLYPILGGFIFKITPIIPLSQNSVFSPDEALAIQSLALLNSIIIITIFVLSGVYLIKQKYFNKPVIICSSIVILFLLFQTSFFGIDPMSLLCILVLLFYINNPKIFSTGILLSLLVNEKVALLYFLYFILTLKSIKLNHVPLLSSFLSCLFYYILRKYGPFEGYDNQVIFSHYLPSFISSFNYIFGLKGLYLNIFPVLILIIFYLFSNTHINLLWLLPILLLLIGMLMNLNFTIGRFVLHALPFFIPAIYQTLDVFLDTRR